MASPRPVPPTVRARAGSARQNRWNTCLAWLASNPMPWSRTATATATSSLSIRMAIGFPSLCSMALTRRLRRIRSIRRASTSAMAAFAVSTVITTPWLSASRALSSTTRATMSPRSATSVLSTAAPASKREISSRSVSSASKRSSSVCNSSADRAATGSKSSRASCSTSAAIRTVVSGVRNSCGHVGDEPLLHRGQLLQGGDLLAQLRGHVVHRGGQPGQVVLSADDHPVGQVARGDALRGPPGRADRRHHLPADQGGDEGEQDDQDDPGADHGVAEHPQGGHLLGQREDQVDLVATGAGQGQRGTGGEPGYRGPTVPVVHLGRGDQQVVAPLDLPGQRRRDAGRRRVTGDRLPASRQDDLELRVAAGAVGEPGGQVEQQLVDVGVVGEIGGVELLLGGVDRLPGLAPDGFLLAVRAPRSWLAASARSRPAPAPGPRPRRPRATTRSGNDRHHRLAGIRHQGELRNRRNLDIFDQIHRIRSGT